MNWLKLQISKLLETNVSMSQKKKIGDKTYELKKRNYTKVFSYEIENISDAILNNLKEVSSPGMTLEETLLNTKILEEWSNA